MVGVLVGDGATSSGVIMARLTFDFRLSTFDFRLSTKVVAQDTTRGEAPPQF